MRRRKTVIFFLVFGICLILLAVALNVGWILLNLREAALLVLGVILFSVIITGLVLNTIFLIREIRRSEQHDAFLNSVTHELKTPIASIKLYVETLKTRDVTDEKRAEFYDVMLADTNRLLGTVEQVLQASRTREKKRQISISEIDIQELLEQAIEVVRSSRNLAGSAIKLSGPPERIKIVGDLSELRTVFVNLLDNAAKYSIEDQKIVVRIKGLATQNTVDIFVRDNGIGIPESELKRIFKRFYRATDQSVDVKGTGLGLSIVKAIVERHGGRVRAQSRGKGLGSTFMVRLPTA